MVVAVVEVAVVATAGAAAPAVVAVGVGAAAGATGTVDPAQAFSVAQLAGGGMPPIGPEVDRNKPGYFFHYHTWNRLPKFSHAFFGLPVLRRGE